MSATARTNGSKIGPLNKMGFGARIGAKSVKRLQLHLSEVVSCRSGFLFTQMA